VCSADQLQWSLCLINVTQCDNLNSVIIDRLPLAFTVCTAVCGCNGRGYCFTTVNEDGSWMHNCNCSSPYYGERCQYGKMICLGDRHHPVTVAAIMCLLSILVAESRDPCQYTYCSNGYCNQSTGGECVCYDGWEGPGCSYRDGGRWNGVCISRVYRSMYNAHTCRFLCVCVCTYYYVTEHGTYTRSTSIRMYLSLLAVVVVVHNVPLSH